MTLRALKIFLTVAELENMTKAAEQLFTTQSSISQVIIDIEKEYKVLLFERFKNSLKLTPIGKEMYKYASSIIKDYNELTNVLKQGCENPRLRIGCSITAGASVIQEIILGILEEIPNLEYHTIITDTHQIEEGILRNDIDIAIVEGSIKSEDIIEIELLEDPMALICSINHKFSGRKSVTIEEIAEEPLIVREEGSGSRRLTLDAFKERGLTPNIVWTCQSQEIVKNLTSKNLGISVMTERAIKDYVNSGKLWACKIDGIDLHRTFRIIYHKDKFKTEPMNLFIEKALLLKEK